MFLAVIKLWCCRILRSLSDWRKTWNVTARCCCRSTRLLSGNRATTQWFSWLLLPSSSRKNILTHFLWRFYNYPITLWMQLSFVEGRYVKFDFFSLENLNFIFVKFKFVFKFIFVLLCFTNSYWMHIHHKPNIEYQETELKFVNRNIRFSNFV